MSALLQVSAIILALVAIAWACVGTIILFRRKPPDMTPEERLRLARQLHLAGCCPDCGRNVVELDSRRRA